MMDKETRKLLAKLFTSQLESLAAEKGIDCGEDPDRIDYLSILGKSDSITKEDVERFIGEMEGETESKVEGEEYFREVERILKDFRTKGSIFQGADDLLVKMQSNFKEGNLKDTISKGIEGDNLISDALAMYEKVRKAYVIYAFRQLLGDVRDSGIDIGEAELLASSAAEHIHKDQTEELDNILGEIAELTQTLTTEQARRMKEQIVEMEELIDQARDLGANIGDAEDLFKKAEEAFDSKAYKKVSYFAAKARKAAEDAKADRIKSISDSLLFVRSILDDAKEIGADVSSAEDIYDKAKTAFEDEKYLECKSLIKEGEQQALELQDAQIKKAMQLRRRRETEDEGAGDSDVEVVEVEPEIVSSSRRRGSQEFPQPYENRYSRSSMPPPGMPPSHMMRKTRCPNCGQSFPVKGGRGPKKIECPFCGMRGMMP